MNLLWDIRSEKTEFASTLLSNFGSKIRNDYIDEMKKYVNVAVFGNCGKSLKGPISYT